MKIQEIAARVKISHLYVRGLLGLGTGVAAFIAITRALDMISTGSTETALLGGVILITSIFLGGWILAKLILGAVDEVKDENVGGSGSSGSSDNTPS